MTGRDFCYWLQGYFELGGSSGLSMEQSDIVRKHLALVFVHEIDPSAGPPAHQAKLDAIHVGDPKPVGASTQPNKVTIEATPHWHGPSNPTFRC